MRVQPYLFFQGRCDEAVAFYAKAIGAEVEALVRFGDMPGAPVTPGTEAKVMHCALRVGETLILASDGENSGHLDFTGVALSLTAADAAEARRLFDALAEGGQVRLPLGPTPFSPSFGMLADRFGVGWMIMVPA